MKWNTTFLTLVSLLSVNSNVNAMEFLPPSRLNVFSDDKEFKLSVVPPIFKFSTSYQFFQKQDFLTLIAFEGERVGSEAHTQVFLYRRKRNGGYFMIWSRMAPSTIIPISAKICVNSKVEPVVILQGEYAQTQVTSIPYSAFKLSGLCVTNSSFAPDATNPEETLNRVTWSFEGELLKLSDNSGKTILTLKP